jgi:hypothetical protein
VQVSIEPRDRPGQLDPRQRAARPGAERRGADVQRRRRRGYRRQRPAELPDREVGRLRRLLDRGPRQVQQRRVHQYTLDFYANPPCTRFPRDFNEGETYLGSSQITTDGAGHFDFDVTLPIGSRTGRGSR